MPLGRCLKANELAAQLTLMPPLLPRGLKFDFFVMKKNKKGLKGGAFYLCKQELMANLSKDNGTLQIIT